MALEGALRELAPRQPALDRDAILFRAGQRAARRSWLWPLATALAASVAAVLGVRLLMQPAPQVVERIVHVPVLVPAPAVPTREPAAEPGTASPEPDAPAPAWQTPQHRLQERLLRGGLDALGRPDPDPEPPRFPGPLAFPLSSSGETLP
jgi:hypothetical protein